MLNKRLGPGAAQYGDSKLYQSIERSVSQWVSSSEILLPSHSPHFSTDVTTLTLNLRKQIYLKAWGKKKITSESQPHSSPQAGLHFKLILPGWPEKTSN